MIPRPPLSASSLRAGYGLTMSKKRKRINEMITATMDHCVKSVNGNNEISCPATSSTTTLLGSFRPANCFRSGSGPNACERDRDNRNKDHCNEGVSCNESSESEEDSNSHQRSVRPRHQRQITNTASRNRQRQVISRLHPCHPWPIFFRLNHTHGLP